MGRPFRLLLLGTLAVMTLLTTFVSPGSGRTAADDVSLVVGLQLTGSPDSTKGLDFQIVVDVVSASGVLQAFTVRIALPAGLRWGRDAPDPSEGCTGTAPAVCMQRMQQNAVGTIGGGWFWDVVAERVGFYEITATIEPEEPDPDLSNNTFTLRFEVKEGTSGGSGGSGGTAAVAASAAKLSPAKPRAGSVVAATVRVTAGGAAIRPSRLSCAGSVGGGKLAGTPRARSGSATCLYRPPRTAKGKILRGAVSFTARGTKFTRRFAARLG